MRKKALAGFSGGMRQRFGIAQALIGNPELIIVDEPTAGLDPEERNRFLNLLAEIGENVVVILSTHIVEDVADLCPRMAVLAGGRIQLEGAPLELIAVDPGPDLEEGDRARRARPLPRALPAHLDPPVRRPDRSSTSCPTAIRATASRRSRATSRTSISPPSPNPAARPEERRRCSRKIAAFEFRYQVRSPLVHRAPRRCFFLARLRRHGGGQAADQSAAATSFTTARTRSSCRTSSSRSLFLFLGAAFVSNVIVRDDQTGFGPIIRSTRITKADYLFGRFAGAFAVGALVMAAVPLGAWLGTLMPFADQEMLGPNRLSGFAYGYGLFALPNALIISAILFALATATRSTAGTFIGVVGLLILYLVGQRLMEGQTQLLNLARACRSVRHDRLHGELALFHRGRAQCRRGAGHRR